jgi:hypothetical protein
MLLGIICLGFNSLYFKKKINFYILFPAKLIFFCCFIGYMALLIVVKWLTKYE